VTPQLRCGTKAVGSQIESFFALAPWPNFAAMLGRKADLDDSFAETRSFYLSFGAVVLVAAVIVLIPGAPLIQALFLTQALNAVLLLVLLPFMRSLGGERRHRNGCTGGWRAHEPQRDKGSTWPQKAQVVTRSPGALRPRAVPSVAA
jgi:hypothetical protein